MICQNGSNYLRKVGTAEKVVKSSKIEFFSGDTHLLYLQLLEET